MIPIRTLAPITSAAMAVQTFEGTAILMIVISVYSFDHNSASTSSVCFCGADPEAAHHFPVFCIVSFINSDLPVPFRAQVRQMVVFLIVLTEDMPHKSSIWVTGYATFVFHHEWNVFCTCPIFPLSFCTFRPRCCLQTSEPWFLHCDKRSTCLQVPISLAPSFLCLVLISHRFLVCVALGA